MMYTDTICAISSAPGIGAIALVRLTGAESLTVLDKIFSSKGNKNIKEQNANTLHFGSIINNNEIVDEVVVSIFKAPHSFTGEDIVEISCHGSVYIQQLILQLLIENGARIAKPGEFTQRAFLNGKMDLAQAEAVADLIASSSKASHKMAINQMKGGVSNKIKNLRDELLHFISLIELELDFSEEDVEFADRSQLLELVNRIHLVISKLAQSFQYGNAIKNGIPVAIIGDTNVGKSTLLNALLNEERAIVSEIAGTTRDVIEDVVTIEGVVFRFIDTAGIRTTHDTIESMGIERTFAKLSQSNIALVLVDASTAMNEIIMFLTSIGEQLKDKKAALIINKIDIAEKHLIDELEELGMQMNLPTLSISAKHGDNVHLLSNILIKYATINQHNESDIIISNIRHYEALTKANEGIVRVIAGLNSGISGDFLAQDIREAMHYLGEITGDISTDEVLGNIFKNFCVGK